MKKNNQPILPIVVLIAALTWTSLARAQQTGTDAETTPAQQALINEMKAMTWLKDTTITLPDSHARLVLPNGHSAVSGRDAKRLDQLINGTSRESDDEAQVVSSDLRYQVNFAFFKGGYVDEGDWYTLDPSKILESVIDATEEANKRASCKRYVRNTCHQMGNYSALLIVERG